MEVLPAYEDSHLLVAAIRILSHRDGRSPTPEDAAALIGFSTEKAYVLVHELRRLGVIRALETPFELRLDVADPVPLEKLPRGGSGPSIEGELSEFHEREQEKKDAMERMFRGGEADRRRKERVSRLEEEFMKFKPKPGAIQGLFKEGEDGESDDPAAEQEPSPPKPARGSKSERGSKSAGAPKPGGKKR